MRSLFDGVLNKATTPIPYASRGGSNAFAGLLGGARGATAQMRAMGEVGTLFAIVGRTSNATSQVDWKLWRKAKSGKKEDRTEVTSHAALDLWNQPNKFMTRQELVEAGQQHVDLTGEGWLAVARDPRARSIPLELWPMRPDRVTPVTSPTDFLQGYIYAGPDGEQVPLETDSVLMLRMPNPLDPYRGMGPVQAIMTNIDASKYSAEWNRNFFLNSAEPGGVIEVPNRLSDRDWNEMVDRWREQHQGVANAHRVAVIEQGKWVTRTFSMRDMQFAELHSVSRDVMLEAFGFPKFMIGAVEDVNRANAEASAAMFAQWLVRPRLERWKGMLNNDLLPLYGATAKDLEFDYEDPVPPNSEAENAARDSRVKAAATLIPLGFDPAETMESFGLPTIKFEKPEPPPPPAPPTGTDGAPSPGAAPAAPAGDGKAPAAPAPAQEGTPGNRAGGNFLDIGARFRDRPVGGDLPDHGPVDLAATDIDLAAVQRDWERHLEALLGQWFTVTAKQRDQVLDAVRTAVTANDVAALAGLTVSSADAAQILTDAMTAMALDAAQRITDEAAHQGVRVEPAAPPPSRFAANAAALAALLGAALANSAGREALRRWSPQTSGDDVVDAVRTHLEGLSTAFAEANLGGALTSAQNTGRLDTILAGPVAAIYGSEVMDGKTCKPCRQINGKWIGNSDDPQITAKVEAIYPNGGYVNCEGGVRCRGTTVAVYRPEQVADEAAGGAA